MAKEILVLNSGSSSLKFSLFSDQKQLLQGEVENIQKESSNFWVKGKLTYEESVTIADYKSAVEKVIQIINEYGSTISGIGHRLVFGGEEFIKPVFIDEKVLQKLRSLSSFAPLHMPQEIMAIEMMQKAFPKTKQIACFDTSFHHTIPKKAQLLGLPQKFSEVRRYGFHGLSFESIVAQFEKVPKKMIIAHLGSGVSLCALKEGKSIDTTMGLTPLGGVLMGTRPGDLDPGALLYLLQEKKISVEKLQEILYHESGLKGVSNITSDMKRLLEEKSPSAKEAISLFCYQIAKTIGSYIVALDGLDALVFTAAIGERSAIIRQKISSQLQSQGIYLDEEKNKGQKRLISQKSSIDVFVIPTQEEQVIAKAFEV